MIRDIRRQGGKTANGPCVGDGRERSFNEFAGRYAQQPLRHTNLDPVLLVTAAKPRTSNARKESAGFSV